MKEKKTEEVKKEEPKTEESLIGTLDEHGHLIRPEKAPEWY